MQQHTYIHLPRLIVDLAAAEAAKQKETTDIVDCIRADWISEAGENSFRATTRIFPLR